MNELLLVGYSRRSRELGQFAELTAIESMQLAVSKGLYLWNRAKEYRKENGKDGNIIVITTDETWFTGENRDKKTIHHTNTKKQASVVNNKPSSTRQMAFSTMCTAGLCQSEEGGKIEAKYFPPAFVFEGEEMGTNDKRARKNKDVFTRFNKTHYFTSKLILEWLDWLLDTSLNVDRKKDTVFMWWDAAPSHCSEPVMAKLKELQDEGVLYVQFIPRNTTMLFQV